MFIQPAYTELVKIIPKGQICLDYLSDNITKWDKLTDEFEKKMKDGNNYIPESRGVIVEQARAKQSKYMKISRINNEEDALPSP